MSAAPRRRLLLLGLVLVPPALAMLAILVVMLMQQGGLRPFLVPQGGSPPGASATLVERGRYLATIGNCGGCHTAEGGRAYAGGRAFRTDYGTVYSSNLTPHPQQGIGAWSVEEFRHTMRHGVSRNGVLTPVFPFAYFRHLRDDDLDALLAYLRTLPPDDAPRIPNALEAPASLPGAMAVWRLLYVRPVPTPPIEDPSRARGAYLAEGVGHCGHCHGSRHAFASQGDVRALWGGRAAGWFAPALHAAPLQRFGAGELARYLRGETPQEIGAYGPMADVIASNLQHLTEDDAQDIEGYLRALPAPPAAPAAARKVRASDESLRTGAAVYETHCADCHGTLQEGLSGKYPALTGSPATTQNDPINLIKIVLHGAVAPSTQGNPNPYTMPPFAQSLSASDVAAVVNFLRTQANADAMPVGADEVHAMGGIK